MRFLRAVRAHDVFRARAFSPPGPLRSAPRGEMYGFTEAPARFCKSGDISKKQVFSILGVSQKCTLAPRAPPGPPQKTQNVLATMEVEGQ